MSLLFPFLCKDRKPPPCYDEMGTLAARMQLSSCEEGFYSSTDEEIRQLLRAGAEAIHLLERRLAAARERLNQERTS